MILQLLDKEAPLMQKPSYSPYILQDPGKINPFYTYFKFPDLYIYFTTLVPQNTVADQRRQQAPLKYTSIVRLQSNSLPYKLIVSKTL